jgi:hypothetical protein
MNSDTLPKIITTEMKSLAISWGEVLVQVFSKNSSLAGVPVVRSLASIINVARGIREHFFVEKIKTFLNCLDEVPASERAKYLCRLRDEEDFQMEVGRTLAELDLLDDHRKPKLAARLFVAYLRKNIDSSTYQSLRFALLRIYAPDLGELESFYDEFKNDPSYHGRGKNTVVALQRLSGCGLIDGPNTGLGSPNMYEINENGQKFVEFALKNELGQK